MQLYVDDPACAFAGTEKWALAEGSIPILWLLILGLKLAWKKGSFTNSEVFGHDWIGVHYDYGINGPTMELPRQYLVDTLELLRPLCATSGCIGVRHIYSALGKATRIGHIVPDSAPYVSSLWAGYRAGRRGAIAEKGRQLYALLASTSLLVGSPVVQHPPERSPCTTGLRGYGTQADVRKQQRQARFAHPPHYILRRITMGWRRDTLDPRRPGEVHAFHIGDQSN